MSAVILFDRWANWFLPPGPQHITVVTEPTIRAAANSSVFTCICLHIGKANVLTNGRVNKSKLCGGCFLVALATLVKCLSLSISLHHTCLTSLTSLKYVILSCLKQSVLLFILDYLFNTRCPTMWLWMAASLKRSAVFVDLSTKYIAIFIEGFPDGWVWPQLRLVSQSSVCLAAAQSVSNHSQISIVDTSVTCADGRQHRVSLGSLIQSW